MRANTRFLSSASAWACSAPSSNTRATWWGGGMPIRPSSIPAQSTPSSTSWSRSVASRKRAAPCASAPTHVSSAKVRWQPNSIRNAQCTMHNAQLGNQKVQCQARTQKRSQSVTIIHCALSIVHYALANATATATNWRRIQKRARRWWRRDWPFPAHLPTVPSSRWSSFRAIRISSPANSTPSSSHVPPTRTRCLSVSSQLRCAGPPFDRLTV